MSASGGSWIPADEAAIVDDLAAARERLRAACGLRTPTKAEQLAWLLHALRDEVVANMTALVGQDLTPNTVTLSAELGALVGLQAGDHEIPVVANLAAAKLAAIYNG